MKTIHNMRKGYRLMRGYGASRRVTIKTQLRYLWAKLHLSPIYWLYRWKYRQQKTKRVRMCAGCAFKHDSSERRNCFKWQPLLAALRLGDTFHCHETMMPKGVSKRYGKYDPTHRADGTPCQPYEHPLCAGYVAMFPERHRHVKEIVE